MKRTTASKRLSFAELHSAGATVQHSSPFMDLAIPAPAVELSDAILQRFVIPFYHYLPDNTVAVVDPLQGIVLDLTPQLIQTLLAHFNWRSRLTGAIFAALCNTVEFQGDIGHLLLRSEVCYAASGYCVALARFNTPLTVQYLRTYLDYYLQRPDLWFDQADAMAALAYLDTVNRTSYSSAFQPLWNTFVGDKPTWNLDHSQRRFGATMDNLERTIALLNGL